jgi:hypothetical protein
VASENGEPQHLLSRFLTGFRSWPVLPLAFVSAVIRRRHADRRLFVPVMKLARKTPLASLGATLLVAFGLRGPGARNGPPRPSAFYPKA